MILNPYFPCDGPRQSDGSTQIPSLTGYEPKSVEFKNIDAEAIEPEDLEPRRVELDRNLGTDPYQIQERFMRNSLTGDMDEFGKLVQRRPTSSHRDIPITTQRRALQTRILKMENYEKCWLHHCICKIQEDCESSRMPIAREKPAALFSIGSEEPGNQFKSSVFKHADSSNLGRSLLEGNKDHLLSQAKSEFMRQEHQVGSLNNCISELRQPAYAQRMELQDAQHEKIESR